MLCLYRAEAAATPPPGETAALADAARQIHTGAGTHRLILLGESHGTRETPLLVERLLDTYAAQGPVLLGLEMPRAEHAALRRYLDSNGDATARAALRAGAFWQVDNDQHDGRRSYAMLDLIDAARRLRQKGRDIALLPYDVAPLHDGSSEWRDAEMARYLHTAMAALPSGRLLVLTGNVHAMLALPSIAPAQMQTPMASRLRDLDPYAVRIDARAGHFWACPDMHCGPLPASAPPNAGGPVEDGAFAGVYHLWVVLPAFTVAPLLGGGAAP